MIQKNVQGFVDFIREQGVIGLAIGVVLGGAVGKVVTSLVSDIIQPIIGLIFGSPEGLQAMAVGPIHYGKFLAVLIDFVIVAAVIYFVFKQLRIDALDKKK